MESFNSCNNLFNEDFYNDSIEPFSPTILTLPLDDSTTQSNLSAQEIPYEYSQAESRAQETMQPSNFNGSSRIIDFNEIDLTWQYFNDDEVVEKKEKIDFVDDMFDYDFYKKIVSNEIEVKPLSEEDKGIIHKLACELKEVKIPSPNQLSTINLDHFLVENNSNIEIFKRRPGRPKNASTDVNSNYVKVGTKKVLKNSQEHLEHLIRTRETVRRFRENKKAARSLKRLNDDVSCQYCSSFYSKRGIKTHEEKCPSRNLTVNCGICGDTFKKFGLKIHQKTCVKMDPIVQINEIAELFESDQSQTVENKFKNIIDLSLLN